MTWASWLQIQTGVTMPGQTRYSAPSCASPPHLLHRVMSVCLTQVTLEDFLTTAIAPLHAAAVSADLKEGVLHVPAGVAAVVLPILPGASFPSPGLQSVRLQGDPSLTFPASSGGLLARGLAAHPSLSRMVHKGSISGLAPRWLRSVAACLRPGALPNLVDLELTVAAHSGGCAALAACLRLLPSLTSLRTIFQISRPQSPEAVPLSAYSRFAGAPAALPCLKNLGVVEDSTSNCVDLKDAGQPLTCLHSFLSLLSAPVLWELCLDWSPYGASVAAVLDLITSTRFPALRDRRIDMAVDTEEAAHMMPGGSAVPTGLPPLTDLSVDSSCPVSMLAIATAVCSAVSATLEFLKVDTRRRGHDKHPVKCAAASLRHVWEPFWEQLGCCKELELAMLDVHDPFVGAAATQDRVSQAVAAALRPLSQLRSLCLSASCPPQHGGQSGLKLSGSVVGGALATLTHLRGLLILDHHCEIEFDSVQPLLDASKHLQHVSHLALGFPGVTVPLLAAIMAEMPALKPIIVEGFSQPGGPVNQLGHLQARFPSVHILQTED